MICAVVDPEPVRAIAMNREDSMDDGLDDDIAALALQLEEINYYDEKRKGKCRENEPPDSDLATSAFQAEVMSHMRFLYDQKLAHSIGRAVSADGPAIAEATQGESQAQQDRRLALQVNRDEHGSEAPPPPYTREVFGNPKSRGLSWAVILSDPRYDTTFAADKEPEDAIAGPSMSYAERQRNALEAVASIESVCSVCFSSFRQCEVVGLECDHVYCLDCLKVLFTRSIKDQTLFPPRCCRKHVPLSLVAPKMSEEELETFHEAEVEFSTPDKTYCSNPDCGRFIPPARIQADRAECSHCGSESCSMCKNAYHYDDCPQDFALKQTLNYTTSQGWSRCPTCGCIVELITGCNHIT